MAHTPESRARAYAKIQQRRTDWFEQNGPCAVCASWDNLELDHINPADKVSHKVWSWSQDRREAELDKCQPLCTDCHKAKTKVQKASLVQHGTSTMYRNHGCRCKLCQEYKSSENSRRVR